MEKVRQVTKNQLKNNTEVRVGDTVRVHQKIKEGEKERIQVFEGLVIAKKHGNGINGTFTVRKVTSGVGVEKIFPIHMPMIEKIEIVKSGKVRRSKIYYIRQATGRKGRLKEIKRKVKESVKEEIKELEKSEEATEENKAEAVEKKEDKGIEDSKEAVKAENKKEEKKEETKNKKEDTEEKKEEKKEK